MSYFYDWPDWYTIDRVKPGELLGSLHTERVRCGKEGCRCQRGELHGPYWYRRYRPEAGGKQHKEYVRADDLPEVRARIEHRHKRLAKEREERKKHMRRGEYARGSSGVGGLAHALSALRRLL